MRTSVPALAGNLTVFTLALSPWGLGASRCFFVGCGPVRSKPPACSARLRTNRHRARVWRLESARLVVLVQALLQHLAPLLIQILHFTDDIFAHAMIAQILFALVGEIETQYSKLAAASRDPFER